MHLLESDLADLVLSRLSPAKAEKLRSRLAGVSENEQLSARHGRLIDDFDAFLRIIRGRLGSPLSVFDPGSSDSAVLAASHLFEPSDDPLADLERVSVNQLAMALSDEQPRTVAIVVGHLTASRSAEVLSLLPEGLRTNAARALSASQTTPTPLLLRIAGTVIKDAAKRPLEFSETQDRIERLGEVLRAVPKPQRRAMLDAIRDEDEQTADQILKRLYLFEDIETQDDRIVQAILGRIDSGTLATALVGASSTMQQKNPRQHVPPRP